MTTPRLPVWYPGRSGVPGIGVVSLQPHDDPFYSSTGSTSLDSVAPGTVLNTRRFHYHLFGFPTLLETTQLLYRSTSQTGKPTVNVTSIIKPPFRFDATRVISYQSAYDSLNPNVEAAVFGQFLAEGYTVIVPDTEGQRANFAAGPEYGMNTLDSIRAALNSSAVPNDAKLAMLGYSGGAIA